MEIALQEFPTQRVAHVGLGIGGNLQTVFQPMLTQHGGKTDFLGFDDGSRAIPAGKLSGAELGRAFSNNWSPYRQTRGSGNYSLSASFGDRAEVAGKRIGYLFALHYSTDTQTRAEELQVLNLVDTAQGPKLSPLVRFGSDEGHLIGDRKVFCPDHFRRQLGRAGNGGDAAFCAASDFADRTVFADIGQ